jgi:hypothetical protein
VRVLVCHEGIVVRDSARAGNYRRWKSEYRRLPSLL